MGQRNDFFGLIKNREPVLIQLFLFCLIRPRLIDFEYACILNLLCKMVGEKITCPCFRWAQRLSGVFGVCGHVIRYLTPPGVINIWIRHRFHFIPPKDPL